MKNPLNSFINVFGLAASIGICIFIYAFARWTYSTDQFHVNKHSVYLITFFANRDETLQQYGRTPRPLHDLLKQDFPQVQKACRVEDRDVVVKVEDKVFHERVRFTDPDFLQMLTFPLKWGSAASLADLNSVIISEEMSKKYFGEDNPIGETIIIKFNQDDGKAFKITGVAQEFPKSRTISFNFLINFQNVKTADPNYDFQDWQSLVNATLIQVDPRDIGVIQQQMEKYKKIHNEKVSEDWAIASFGFEPLATLHERADEIRDDISRSSKNNYESVIYLGVVAALLLALACFNYINIAIVTASKRLKEIGVRKSIGATRKMVIIQFLSENIVVTLFAMIIGLALGYTFFVPGFEYLFSFDMDFRLIDPTLWLYLLLLLMFTTVASGIYPSLYISYFQVVSILKGTVKFGNRNPVTRVLLCFQLILACAFITCAVMFAQNTAYMSKRSWGYEPREALYTAVPDYASYEKLAAIMVSQPDVTSIAGSAHHLGKSNSKSILHTATHELEVDELAVGANYFETMGLEIKEGRVFKDHEGSDRNSVIVNERFVQSMGKLDSQWQYPVGLVFRIDSIEYQVIGVVKDFHSYNFFRKVLPTIFTVAEKEDYRYLSVKVREGSGLKAIKTLQTAWATLFPETPFEGGLQEDVWGFYFEEISIHSLVWKVFASIAILLATLGLYGLVKLNVTSRVKEFSIRKVLGAGIKSLAILITRQYLLLFSLALLLGAPISYLLVRHLLNSAYTYHMPITFSGTIIGCCILTSILLFTVSTQIKNVVKGNAVEGLRGE